ncbi:hypothetical protein P7J50_11855 [Streptococcus suis]
MKSKYCHLPMEWGINYSVRKYCHLPMMWDISIRFVNIARHILAGFLGAIYGISHW